MITSKKFNLVEGGTAIATFTLANKVIMSVSREGVGFTEVSGTPQSGEWKRGNVLPIMFSDDQPGAPGGERVHVIYRTI